MRKLHVIIATLLIPLTLVGCHKPQLIDDEATKQDETEQIDEQFSVTPDVVGDDSESVNQNAYVDGELTELLTQLNNTFNESETYETLSKEAIIDMYSLPEDVASDAIGYYSIEENNFNCVYVFNAYTDIISIQTMIDEVQGAIEATYEIKLDETQFLEVESETSVSFAFGTSEFVSEVNDILNGGVQE